MGLIGGVFYREFTKLYQYDAPTHPSKLHVHTLVLGFLTLLLLYVLVRRYDNALLKGLRRPFYIYMTGLVWSIVAMTVFGIWEVVSQGNATVNIKALEGISGLGHIILSVGLVWLVVKVIKAESSEKEILLGQNK